MKWTAVDLAIIGGIVDDMADPPFKSDPPLPERMRTMLDGEGVDPDDPDNPQVDAAGVTALSYAMQFGTIIGTDAEEALKSCLQEPLPDPNHGG